jgi:hypothetical protein
MLFDLTWPWLALLGLGAFHGINPGMGWLFAVALGLQEQHRAAVWHALLPLALGHALAIGVAVLAMYLAGQFLPLGVLKWIVAAMLLGFGLYRLFRHRHPRFGGMHVGARDLAVWSFLMATAHGAGLMVLPFVFGTGAVSSSGGHGHAAHDHAAHMMDQAARATSEAGHIAAGGHAHHAALLLEHLPAEPLVGLAAIGLHSVGYLVIMGLLAVVVYEKLGLRLLRTHWLNLDVVWATALIVTALVTILI